MRRLDFSLLVKAFLAVAYRDPKPSASDMATVAQMRISPTSNTTVVTLYGTHSLPIQPETPCHGA